MNLLRVLITFSFLLQSACAVALKPPRAAATARLVEGAYGSSIMRLDEFSVTGVDERRRTTGVSVIGVGGVTDESSTTRFTVMRQGRPFLELTCSAGSEAPVMRMGSYKLNHPAYRVACDGDGFSLRLNGDPERPLSGVARWRDEEYRVKTTFETANGGTSAHLGFVVEARDGWVSTADIQGPTWVAQPLREEAREAMVLANFGWASRRRVVTAEATGFIINRL
ncbi:MAG: hypothetical protein INH41_18200 [Myxococcaceae bacterium]|jgi:hypothetical protein|nr:hypothetical protein [Myxococcaceae bacterium]MCA3014319.1 hypothetical protein [Myxococcaceae bacterium]